MNSSTIMAQRAQFLGKAAHSIGWQGRAVCLVTASVASYLWANHRFKKNQFEKKLPSLTIALEEGEEGDAAAEKFGIHFSPTHRFPSPPHISKHLCNIGFTSRNVSLLMLDAPSDEKIDIDQLITKLIDTEGNEVGCDFRKRKALCLYEYTTKIEENQEKLFISTKVSGEVVHTENGEYLDMVHNLFRYAVYTIGVTSSMVGVSVFNFLSQFMKPVSSCLMCRIPMLGAQASLVGFVIAFPFLVYLNRIAVNVLETKQYDTDIHLEKDTDVIITTGPKEEGTEESEEVIDTNQQLMAAALFGGSLVGSLGYVTGALLGTVLCAF